MASQTLVEIMQKAEELTPDEHLQLIAYLAERARQVAQMGKARRSLRELEGTAPYPALGEDAQQWVSRTRRESDEHRKLPEREIP